MFTVEMRADDNKVEGYGAVFNTSTNIGWFTEEIRADAFDEADMTDVVWVFNHNTDNLLGRTSSGTVTLKTDKKGLRYEGVLPNTSLGNDMRELISRGDITANSFAFTIAEDGQTWEKRGGTKHRTITKIDKLYDVSLVTTPAYKEAIVVGRSAEAHKDEPVKEFVKRYKKGNLKLLSNKLNANRR